MLEAIVGIIGTFLLGTIGWAFTLNSRVAVLEADKISLKELLTSQLIDIKERLSHIETKIDRNYLQ